MHSWSGLVAFVGNNKTVTLNVDGKVTSVQTFGGTVGQVVKSANLELKPADRVSPSADESVQNGTVINVNMAKAVKVSLDGSEKTVSTTAPDVAGLVTELGVASASSVSAPKDAQLAVARLLRFHLHPEDRQHRCRWQTSPRQPRRLPLWQDVLEDAGVTLGVNDRTSQPGQRPCCEQHGGQSVPR